MKLEVERHTACLSIFSPLRCVATVCCRGIRYASRSSPQINSLDFSAPLTPCILCWSKDCAVLLNSSPCPRHQLPQPSLCSYFWISLSFLQRVNPSNWNLHWTCGNLADLRYHRQAPCWSSRKALQNGARYHKVLTHKRCAIPAKSACVTRSWLVQGIKRCTIYLHLTGTTCRLANGVKNSRIIDDTTIMKR